MTASLTSAILSVVRHLLLLVWVTVGLAACSKQRVEGLQAQGDVKLSRGDLVGALQSYDKALGIDPNAAAAHSGRGEALRLQGKTDEARSAFKKALGLNPKEGRALTELGRISLADEESRPDGLKLCDQAVEVLPDDAKAWGCACVARGMARKTKEAVEACQRAVDLDPDVQPTLVWATLARVLDEDYQHAKAVPIYQDLLRRDPKNAHLHYRIAGCFAHTGSAAKALEHLQEAVRISPRMDLAHRALAEYYVREGDCENGPRWVRSSAALGQRLHGSEFDAFVKMCMKE